MQKPEIALTFERFIEEAKGEVERGKNFTGVVVFSEKDAWLHFDDAVLRFNSVRRRWKADILNTYQDDFLILRFKDSLAQKDDRHFFVKSSSEERYVDLSVFSFEGYDGFRVFKSLIKYVKNTWLGWVGSQFLERFDTLLEEMYQDYAVELVKSNYVTRHMESKKPKGTVINRIPVSKEEFLELRKFYQKQNQLLYLQKITYEVSDSGEIVSKVSLSDRTEFTLETGDIVEFLSLFREILCKAQQERDLFTKTRTIRKYEQKIDTLAEPVEVTSFEIDRIEIIEVDVSNPISNSWFQNLVSTFSAGYLKEYDLVSSVVNETNPYFLAKVTDLENSSRIFLSATSKSLRISPATENTKPSTLSKLFTILQSQVDPSIGTGASNVA